MHKPSQLPHTTTHIHTHADTYYTPEGERKRVLALPLEEGREYFTTPQAMLGHITQKMIAYFDTKEKRSERRMQELLTPGTI
jgi:hypothetical protein